jgi:transcription elongation factor Elf1
MRELFRDAEHLFRLALLFLALLVIFLVVRAALVPKGFGTYGHYRAGALVDVRARALTFAGRAACLDCHDAVDAVKKAGKHAGLGCESCHGPANAHVADAGSVVPPKLDAKTLCVVCHLENLAKPKGFPQIDPKEHAGDASCVTCHDPHTPLPVKG